jgi:hypothetical protein
MRSHRRWCLFFSASISSLVSVSATTAYAQLASPAPFNHNVWQPAKPNPPREHADVRQAYFQGPGAADGLQMPMPQFSDAGSNSLLPSTDIAGPVAPAYGDNQSMPPSAVNPAAFNQFSNPGGAMPPTQVQGGAHLRDRVPTNQPGVYPPANNPAANNPGAVSNPTPGFRNTAMQQPVMPPNYGMQTGGIPNNAYATQEGNLAPSQFRNSTAGNGMNNQPGSQYQMPVVSNDRRFVSPPPPQRQGYYATSPYQGPYRTVSYQLPQQSPPTLPVGQASLIPNQPQAVGATTTLPQYQPTVGAQLTSYQAMQPGVNCAPGIPSNGVPSYVPGAVAPPTLPPNLTPGLYTPDNSGYRPLFSLGQENYNVQLGRGIIGQPTVYVSGQPIRNFLRYISP